MLDRQCDQIERFIGLWATFNRHLAIFYLSHCWQGTDCACPEVGLTWINQAFYNQALQCTELYQASKYNALLIIWSFGYLWFGPSQCHRMVGWIVRRPGHHHHHHHHHHLLDQINRNSKKKFRLTESGKRLRPYILRRTSNEKRFTWKWNSISVDRNLLSLSLSPSLSQCDWLWVSLWGGRQDDDDDDTKRLNSRKWENWL